MSYEAWITFYDISQRCSTAREKSLKSTTAFPCPVSGKEQQRMFATRLDKIIFKINNAVGNINKGYVFLSLLHFLVGWLVVLGLTAL